MISRSPTVYETSYSVICQVLRRVLVEAVESGRGAGSGIGSVQLRATATLYGLLLSHPIDQRGRCRSCRRSGVVLGLRRRRCRVRIAAHFYLHQSDDVFFLSHLGGELGLTASPPSRADAAESGGQRPPLSQAPAVPPAAALPGGFPRAGWPDPGRGGVREAIRPPLAPPWPIRRSRTAHPGRAAHAHRRYAVPGRTDVDPPARDATWLRLVHRRFST